MGLVPLSCQVSCVGRSSFAQKMVCHIWQSPPPTYTPLTVYLLTLLRRPSPSAKITVLQVGNRIGPPGQYRLVVPLILVLLQHVSGCPTLWKSISLASLSIFAGESIQPVFPKIVVLVVIVSEKHVCDLVERPVEWGNRQSAPLAEPGPELASGVMVTQPVAHLRGSDCRAPGEVLQNLGVLPEVQSLQLLTSQPRSLDALEEHLEFSEAHCILGRKFGIFLAVAGVARHWACARSGDERHCERMRSVGVLPSD